MEIEPLVEPASVSPSVQSSEELSAQEEVPEDDWTNGKTEAGSTRGSISTSGDLQYARSCPIEASPFGMLKPEACLLVSVNTEPHSNAAGAQQEGTSQSNKIHSNHAHVVKAYNEQSIMQTATDTAASVQ